MKRPARRAGVEQLFQRAFERFVPDDVTAAGEDDALELGQVALAGLEVQRAHVEQRVVDGHHEQMAEDHVAAALRPQRELGADLRRLVDEGADLVGSVDQRLLGKR